MGRIFQVIMFILPSIYIVVMHLKNPSHVKTVQADLCLYVNGVDTEAWIILSKLSPM